MFVHMTLTHPIEKWVNITTSPIGLIGADRTVRVMRSTWAPVLHQVEASHALPLPAFGIPESS